jgi:hypothetical protein
MDTRDTNTRYTPELLFKLMSTVQNIVLIAVCGWTVTTLYAMSGSWHCLWALLMLGLFSTGSFIRD